MSFHLASRNAASEASTTEEQARLKIVHLRKELEEKEPKAAIAEKQNYGLLEEVASKKREQAELEVMWRVADVRTDER